MRRDSYKSLRLPLSAFLVAVVFAPHADFQIHAAPPANDGSYIVARIEPSSTGGALTFRQHLVTRRLTVQHNSPENAFEVDLRSGLFVLRQTDLFVKDSMPLCLTRTYRPGDAEIHALGMGTNHPYDVSEYGSRRPYTYIDLVLEDFDTVHFDRVSPGTGFEDAVYTHAATASEFYGSRLGWNGDGWTLALRNGFSLRLPEAYNAKTQIQAAVVELRNAQGKRIQFDRDPVSRNLRHLTSPSGHAITFEYTPGGIVSSASDDAGDEADYYYDSEKRLYAVSRNDGHSYRFEYDHGSMTLISDEKGRILLDLSYDQSGRVETEKAGDGSVFHYRYVVDEKGRVTQVFVTVPDGTIYRIDGGTAISKLEPTAR